RETLRSSSSNVGGGSAAGSRAISFDKGGRATRYMNSSMTAGGVLRSFRVYRAGPTCTSVGLPASRRPEVLPEEVDLHLLPRDVELRIGNHVRRGQGDHLGALAGEIERFDERERVREVDVVVGDPVDEEQRALELGRVR